MATSFQLDGVRVARARAILRDNDGRALTQVAFAGLVGLHPVTMNRVENNKTRVSLSVVEKIATLTGRTREYLLGEVEQVDGVEMARGMFAHALEQMQDGFEDFNAAIDLLTARAKDAAVLPEPAGTEQ